MNMTSSDLEKIYQQYRNKVMGYIRARIRSQADAEDLCAEVFEKIYQKIEGYQEEKASISTWIFTITRNTVIDFFRRSRPSDELDENMADDQFQVDGDLMKRETLGELAQALRSLPEQMRDIIVLRYYDGKPLTDIAKMMNLSYGAVKLRHQAALERLKQILTA